MARAVPAPPITTAAVDSKPLGEWTDTPPARKHHHGIATFGVNVTTIARDALHPLVDLTGTVAGDRLVHALLMADLTGNEVQQEERSTMIFNCHAAHLLMFQTFRSWW